MDRRTITIKTRSQTELIDITNEVSGVIGSFTAPEGFCHIYVPHTTAAITINESADPAVRDDILMALNKIVGSDEPYRHREGNSPAHIKATLVGASELVAVEKGRLVLGTWQGIFLCEFDGPRTRKVHIRLMS